MNDRINSSFVSSAWPSINVIRKYIYYAIHNEIRFILFTQLAKPWNLTLNNHLHSKNYQKEESHSPESSITFNDLYFFVALQVMESLISIFSISSVLFITRERNKIKKNILKKKKVSHSAYVLVPILSKLGEDLRENRLQIFLWLRWPLVWRVNNFDWFVLLFVVRPDFETNKSYIFEIW